jgi:hypothetical protein
VRFRFSVLSVLVASVTGVRPFDEVPLPGASGVEVFASLSARLGRVVPDPLARLLRTELLWHLEPPPGTRNWLRKPLSQEVVTTTLLSFVGPDGPRDALSTLGLRVDAFASKQGRPLEALPAAIRSGDETARQVLADEYEERGLAAQAEWLRLESELQTARAGRQAALLQRLSVLRPTLPATFLAEVSRPTVEGCPIRFGLKCPRQWADLERTTDAERRYCATCDALVHFVHDAEAARSAARLGRCVAIAPTADRRDEGLIEMGMPLVPQWDVLDP